MYNTHRVEKMRSGSMASFLKVKAKLSSNPIGPPARRLPEKE